MKTLQTTGTLNLGLLVENHLIDRVKTLIKCIEPYATDIRVNALLSDFIANSTINVTDSAIIKENRCTFEVEIEYEGNRPTIQWALEELMDSLN